MVLVADSDEEEGISDLTEFCSGADSVFRGVEVTSPAAACFSCDWPMMMFAGEADDIPEHGGVLTGSVTAGWEGHSCTAASSAGG